IHLLKIDPITFIRRRIPAPNNGTTTPYTDTANKFSRSLKVLKARREPTPTSVTVMRTDVKEAAGERISNRGMTRRSRMGHPEDEGQMKMTKSHPFKTPLKSPLTLALTLLTPPQLH